MFLPVVHKGSNFSRFSPTLRFFCFIESSHLNRYEELHFRFGLCLISDVEYLCVHLLTSCVFSLETWLFKSFAMWNTMMVDNAFFKNTNGSFGKSSFVLVRQIHIQSRSLLSKNKMIPFPRWKLCSVSNLPTGNWLIASGNGATLGWVLVSAGRLGTQQ